jgi:hypothetical protein
MPKYSFCCKECNTIKSAYVNADVKKLACSTCNGEANRLPPTVNKPNVTELIDPYTSVHLSADHREDIDQRSSDYFWAVEVPRLCADYPPAECLHKGWAYLSEQGDFCIHTKPPNKR